MEKDNLTISQSLLKALTKYAEKKECGLKVEMHRSIAFLSS